VSISSRRPKLRTTPATLVVLLAGALAAALVVARSSPPADAPRRPADDAEVLEQVVPRATARDAGVAGPVDAGESAP
jgi:hypothetical protein